MSESKIAIKRIKIEMKKLEIHKPKDYTYIVKDLFNWDVTIVGPPDTPYAGRDYLFNVTFTAEYPMKPPVMTFIRTSDNTPMKHNNITPNKVCVDILQDKWSPAMTIDALIIAIRSLIAKGD